MMTYIKYIIGLAKDETGQIYLTLLLDKLFEEKKRCVIEYLKWIVLLSEEVPEDFKKLFVKKCLDLMGILIKEENENNGMSFISS